MVMTIFAAMPLTASAASDVSINLSSPGSSGTGYTYSNTILKITGAGNTYKLSGTMTGHIIVTADCTIELLNGAKITAGSKTQTSKYSSGKTTAIAGISIESGANVTLRLPEGSSSTITSSVTGAAGIEVCNYITSGTPYLSSLTITGSGTLTVKGGGQSAAIGGGMNHPTGNITIESGTITATGGDWAPAIGDGDSDSGKDYINWHYLGETTTGTYTCSPAKITISGGMIKAFAGYSTPGIGSSDELSESKHASGKSGRVWGGLSIHITGDATILTVSGTVSSTSYKSYSGLGAGNKTVMPKDSIIIDKGVTMVALSHDAGHPLNSNGTASAISAPSISDATTANVLSLLFSSGTKAGSIYIRKLVENESGDGYTEELIDSVQKLLNESSISTRTFKGFAAVLPDGMYKIVGDDGSTIYLEGGGLAYGDSTSTLASVKVETYVNGVQKSSSDIGKTFRLKKSSTYYNPGVVTAGTYTLHELYEDGTYSGALDVVIAAGSTTTDIVVSNQIVTVKVYYYTYTYDDGQGGSETVYVPTDDDTATKPEPQAPDTTPEKDGYTFDEWEQVLDEDGKPTDEFIAKYLPITYSVRFNANGGNGSMDNQTLTYDEPANLTSNAFTRTGYIFKGWATSQVGVYSGGDATWTYLDGASVKENLSKTQGATVNLYAVWEATTTVSGTATIDYAKTNPDQRADGAVLELKRRVVGSNEDFDPVLDSSGEPVTVTVSFDSTKDTDSAIYSFPSQAVTDEYGNAYEYYVETTVSNYYSVYDTDSNTNFTLNFNPECVTIHFDVKVLSSIPVAVQPSEIYVKVLWDDNGISSTDGSAKTPDRGVITQHSNSYVTATKGADGKYSGSYPVWKHVSGDEPYYYQIIIVGYKIQNETIWLTSNTSATDTKFYDPDSGVYTIVYDYDLTDSPGYNVGSSGEWVSYVDENTQDANGDVTCNARVEAVLYAPLSWAVTYVENGGSDVSDTTYTYGTGISTLPTTSKDHYDFTGWHDGTSVITSITATDHGEKTLTAQWSPTVYTIEYDSSIDKNSGAYPSEYTVESVLTIPTPAQTGYTFEGWYTDEGLTTQFSSDNGGNVKLYPKWSANRYTVKFIANVYGNTDTPVTQSFTYDVSQDLTACSYSAAGFTFLGWATAPDATTFVHADGVNVSNLTPVSGGTVYLYGVWGISAEAKIFYSYIPDGQTDSVDILDGTRADSATITLARLLPDSDGTYTGDFTDVDSVDVNFTTGTTTKETFGGKNYLYDTKDFGFDVVQTADADGNLYKFKTTTTVSGYDVAYGTISSGNLGTPGYTSDLSMTLTYNPNNFDVKFYATFDSSIDSEHQPDEVYVKISYIQQEGKSGVQTGIIMQHTNVYVTLTANTKNADDTITYYGTYPVWKHESGDDNALYGYQLEVIGYKLGDDIRWVSGTDEDGDPITLATGYTADYSRTPASDAATPEDSIWVYYLEDGSTPANDISATMIATISAESYGITYETDEGKLQDDADVDYTYGAGLETLPTPEKPGYIFDGWHTDPEFDEDSKVEEISADEYGDVTLYAKWKKRPAVIINPEIDITVPTKPDGGDVTVLPEKSKEGDNVVITTKPDDGNHVVNVIIKDKNGNIVEFTPNGDGTFSFDAPASDVTITVIFGEEGTPVAPEVSGVSRLLETGDHISYLNGYPDGTIRPRGNMTRAEAAQMFYNLLKNTDISITASFSDIKADSWYEDAVLTLASLGIISGYDGSTFKPNANISRAEFATMAMRFAVVSGGYGSFSDVNNGYWAYSYIMSAAGYGWINGYTDGTFRPEDDITRGEVAAIVNHMLGRDADKAYVDANADVLHRFTDLTDKSAWYYYDMIEATNWHDYDKDDDSTEEWTGLK